MNEFARNFLNEDWALLPGAPRVYLGAFGKHAGWNDHLDDIGLVTASLISARRLLYGGIAFQIENAAWDKAGSDRVAVGFNHLFHWRRPEESLTGLVWSSQDGKGRSLYPMILVVHCVGQPFTWVTDVALPTLQSAAAACRATASAPAVLAILNDAQQMLRRRSVVLPPAPAAAGRPGPSQGFFRRETVALQRVLHHVRHQFALFAPGATDWWESDRHAQSRGLRLPQIPGAHPMESIDAWLAFLGTQIDPAVPLLGVLRLDEPWLDVIAGEPVPADFFVLRARTTAVPLVTDIPYQLDPQTLAACATLSGEVEHRQFPETSLFNHKPAAMNRAAAVRWLGQVRSTARMSFLRRLFGTVGRGPN